MIWECVFYLNWCVFAAFLSRLQPNQRSWTFISVLVILRVMQLAEFALDHKQAALALSLGANWLFIAGTFWNDGWGKRLGKKLKSMALTAVNAASFKRQQAEAFSLRGTEG